MHKQAELSRLAQEWIRSCEGHGSALERTLTQERIAFRCSDLALQHYGEHTRPNRIGPRNRAETDAIDEQLSQVADGQPDPAMLAEWLDSRSVDRRRLPAEYRPRIRGTRPRQSPVVARRPLTPGHHTNRFGCTFHSDGYVFGTRLAYRKRIRDGVEKRILMVVG